MKRVMCLICAVLLTLAPTGLFVHAAPEDMPFVYVTVANGEHELVYERLRVVELVDDGVTTVHEVLYTVHEMYCPDPVTDYYRVENTEYGKSITKLWGVENGGAYGYYVNNVMGLGLDQNVEEDDHVYFFVYTDTEALSDTYSFFDVNTAEVKGKETMTLTLSAASFDANWNPVTVPVANATVTIDGKRTEYKTDAYGKVTLPVKASGTVVISAESDDMNLVPPVCVVKANYHYVGLGFLILGIALAVAGVAATVWIVWKKREANPHQ